MERSALSRLSVSVLSSGGYKMGVLGSLAEGAGAEAVKKVWPQPVAAELLPQGFDTSGDHRVRIRQQQRELAGLQEAEGTYGGISLLGGAAIGGLAYLLWKLTKKQ